MFEYVLTVPGLIYTITIPEILLGYVFRFPVCLWADKIKMPISTRIEPYANFDFILYSGRLALMSVISS